MSDMSSKFYVVVNDSNEQSWTNEVWKDIDTGDNVFQQNNTLTSPLLKKLKKLHFSNRLNSRMWLPLKCIWDRCCIIRPDMLDKRCKNFIIFHSGVKFSAHYIAKLKRVCNVKVVLYLPDTIRTLGIARDVRSFRRYCKHYHIDQVYSFDEKDCEEFGIEFFDIYSSYNVCMPDKADSKGVLYVGNSRSRQRLAILHELYEKLHTVVPCTFYINGVDADKQKYADGIHYNTPLAYSKVLELINSHDTILEIINEGQSGNTLRFKEAVCFNKRLMTNNKSVLGSKYYNADIIQYFNDITDVNTEWFKRNIATDYKYDGNFSPRELEKKIYNYLKSATTLKK